VLVHNEKSANKIKPREWEDAWEERTGGEKPRPFACDGRSTVGVRFGRCLSPFGDVARVVCRASVSRTG
jgi:hypothetical protein